MHDTASPAFDGTVTNHDPLLRAPDIPGCSFVRNLGAGATANVYLYRSAEYGYLAAKVTRQSLSAITHDRYRTEINALTRLSSHPNILTVRDSLITADGRGCMLLDYAPNGSAQDLIRIRPVPQERATQMVLMLADALHTAHRRGIIHRDVKPSNVLFDAHGMPLLADFGICADLYRPMLLTGHSPLWSAPEVLAGLSGGTDRSDVYSLGATLFALLTGMPPCLQDIQHEPRECPSRPREPIGTPVPHDGISPAMRRVLRKALCQHPDDRYGSMAEFAEALNGLHEPAHARLSAKRRNGTDNRMPNGIDHSNRPPSHLRTRRRRPHRTTAASRTHRLSRKNGATGTIRRGVALPALASCVAMVACTASLQRIAPMPAGTTDTDMAGVSRSVSSPMQTQRKETTSMPDDFIDVTAVSDADGSDPHKPSHRTAD